MTNKLHSSDVISAIIALVAQGEINLNFPGSSVMRSVGSRRARRRGLGGRFYGFKVFDDAAGDNPKFIDAAKSAAHEDEDVYVMRTYLRSPVTTLHIKLDVGDPMNGGAVGVAKSFLGAVCANCGIASADKMADRVSFVTYADRPITKLNARSAKKIRMLALWAAVEDRQGLTAVNDWRDGLRAMWRHLRHPVSPVRSALSTLRPGAVSLLRKSLLKLRQGCALLLDKGLYSPSRWQHWARSRIGNIASDEGKGGGLALALSSDGSSQRGICMIVTDFSSMNKADWEAVLYCKHDVIAVFVQDKRERELPEVSWPGAHYRLEDCRGQTLSLWVVADHLPRWMNFLFRLIPGWMKFKFRLTPRWLVAILQRIFGTATTREQFAANFRRHEEEILKRLEECGATTVIVRTDRVDEAIREVLSTLASKKR